MITRRSTIFPVLMLALTLGAGCGGGDLSTMITTNAELRDKVMGVISGNGAIAGQMTDRLLAADSTQAIVIDRLFANGGAVQEILARVAKDRTMVDGVLKLAVQDSSMKTHVMTLFQGMAMGSAPR